MPGCRLTSGAPRPGACPLPRARIQGFAILPDGTEALVAVHRRLGLQLAGRLSLRGALALPKGTIVGMEFRVDNSERNPRNPIGRRVVFCWGKTPPMRWAISGSGSDAIRRRSADAVQRSSSKILAEDAIGYETMLLAPNDASLHTDTALIYWDLGKSSAPSRITSRRLG
jgi:hypothetical protein